MRAILLLTMLTAGCLGDATSSLGEAAPDEPASAASVVEVDGTASVRVVGVCAATVCAGAMRWQTGELPLETDVRDGVLTLTWRADLATEETLRATLRLDGDVVARAEGRSPLVIELPELLAGDYELAIWPGGAASAGVDVDATWTFRALAG
ncbi:MAG TPA: hypothetical protein VM582_03775 [Candidatus Thermoplasmatota archaeon]|nr:hypothetical protein [Candidatus Thermoplasmatota archaeon]